MVEHLLAPHSIAAPLHRHTKEDEFSLILEGRVWFHAAGEEYVAEIGDLVFKPRGEWHTFWNADDEPARVLEMISPGGLEEAFRTIDTAPPDLDLGPSSRRTAATATWRRPCRSWRSTVSPSGECPVRGGTGTSRVDHDAGDLAVADQLAPCRAATVKRTSRPSTYDRRR